MGGSVQDEARAMALDSNDNIYTTGFFVGGFPGADFDPGPDFFPLSGNSGREVFISVIDSDGSFVDAEAMVGNSNDWGNDIVLDNAGNVYITGNFVFDIRKFPHFDIDSNGSMDGFLFKFGNEPNSDPINFPPVAIDDEISVGQGCSQILNIASNDLDADGTLLVASITIIEFPMNGNIMNNDDGTLYYVHNGNAELTDHFCYTIDDNDGASSNVATVNISIVLDVETCATDCNGDFGGTATTDLCGVCDSDPGNDNTTCLDCAGVPNGSAIIGTTCTTGSNLEGTYDSDCNCIPNESTGVISIVVDWQNSCGSRSINLKLAVPGTSEILFEFNGIMSADGTYLSPTVPGGNYDLLIKVGGTLAKLIQNIEVGDGETTVETGVLTKGDLNNDNCVNMADISFFNVSFLTIASDADYNIEADLNCDGAINLIDVSLFNGIYGLIGDSCIQP